MPYFLRLQSSVFSCCDSVLRYFINLCQGIQGGLPGCPQGATVCRRSAAGKTETLGRVYTQRMSYTGQPMSSVFVRMITLDISVLMPGTAHW